MRVQYNLYVNRLNSAEQVHAKQVWSKEPSEREVLEAILDTCRDGKPRCRPRATLYKCTRDAPVEIRTYVYPSVDDADKTLGDILRQEDWDEAVSERRAEETARENDLWDAGAEARYYDE